MTVCVAIIGAGPAGLTLARLLQHQTAQNTANVFDVRVYEKDTTQYTRQQGGTLDLHPRAGQLAIEQAGLMDKFRERARPEGQDLRILDKNDQVHLDHVVEGGKAERPEIDRTVLRDMLLESLLPNSIQWGYKLLSISPSARSAGPTYALRFDNGKVAEADVVVGADGAWSRVRDVLTDVKPIYTGVTVIELCLTDIDKKHPDLGKYVGRGSVFVFSDGKGIQAQRNSTGSVRVYVGLTVPHTWITESGIQSDTPGDVRTKLLEIFRDWKSQSIDLIRKCDDDHIVARALHALPVAPSGEESREKEGRWQKQQQHNGGVTLIGDSAHLTGPSGKGVNYAMLDSLLLSKGLLGIRGEVGRGQGEVKEELQEVVKEYQKGLFERCREAGGHAEKTMKLKYAQDAPAALVAAFKKAHS